MIFVANCYNQGRRPDDSAHSKPINFIKEWRQFISIKGFPLNEYYQEILEIVNNYYFKLNSNELNLHDDSYRLLENEKQDTLDLTGEKRFIEDLRLKL